MKRSELLKKLEGAMRGAGSTDAQIRAVGAVMDEAKSEAEEELKDERNEGKPRTEMLTFNQVKELLDERDRKMQERFDALLKGKSEREADRTLPFEIKDAELAADAYRIEPLSLERRMVMTRRDLDEAGITGKERDLTLVAQQQAGHLYLVGHMLGKKPFELRRYVPYKRTLQALRETRAMDEFTPGEGQEWVPARWTGRMLEAIEQSLIVAGLFPHIQMSTLTETYALSGAKPVVYHLGNYPLSDVESAIPASTPGTGSLQMTAKDLLARVIIASNLTEDAAFAVVTIEEGKMRRAAAEAIEDALINGDPTAALDTGFTYTLHPRTAFKGLRAWVVAGNSYDVTTGSTSFEVNDLDAVRLLMGSNYGGDLSRLFWLTSFLGSTRIGQLSEVRTVDKYGPGATILTGETARVAGVPLIVSPKYPQDLNASGVYDGVTTTKTSILAVHRDAFVVGDRKDMTIESAKKINTQQLEVVLCWRGAFQRTENDDDVIGQAYNVG